MGPLPAAVGGGGGRCAAFGAPKTAGSARVRSRACRNRAPMRAVAHRAAVTTRTTSARGTPDVRLFGTASRRVDRARSSPIARRRRPGQNGQDETAAAHGLRRWLQKSYRQGPTRVSAGGGNTWVRHYRQAATKTRKRKRKSFSWFRDFVVSCPKTASRNDGPEVEHTRHSCRYGTTT